MHRLVELLSYAFFIISQLIVASTRLTCAEYTTVYLGDACHCTSIACQPLVVDPHPHRFAGFVFLSRDPSSLQHEFHCLLTVRAPPRMHVHVQLEAVDLPMVAGTCRGAILQIYDGPSATDFKQQLIGVCGSALPLQRGFSSTGNEVTLSYHQGQEMLHANKSFNVTFTYFTTRKSGCRETEFRCTGGHYGCVSGELTCDGVDNCGDASDESSDYNACGKYSPSSNPAVGGSVGVLVVLAVFGLLVGLGLYGAKKRTQARRTLCLQLAVSDAANQVVAANRSTTANTTMSRDMNAAQHRPLDGHVMPRLPEVGSPLGVVDDEAATVTTYRIVQVTPNPSRRQLQLTVVPCADLLPPSELIGNAALRTSPPPAYESLFPSAEPSSVEGQRQPG